MRAQVARDGRDLLKSFPNLPRNVGSPGCPRRLAAFSRGLPPFPGQDASGITSFADYLEYQEARISASRSDLGIPFAAASSVSSATSGAGTKACTLTRPGLAGRPRLPDCDGFGPWSPAEAASIVTAAVGGVMKLYFSCTSYSGASSSRMSACQKTITEARLCMTVRRPGGHAGNDAGPPLPVLLFRQASGHRRNPPAAVA